MKTKTYVDGSYNASIKVYSADMVPFLGEGADPAPLSRPGDHPAFIGSRDVASEVTAATLAIEAYKKVPDLEELTLYYDYVGIECWAKGSWRANTAPSQGHRDAVKGLPPKLSFHKVKVYTGDEYNGTTDKLVKQACGLQVTYFLNQDVTNVTQGPGGPLQLTDKGTSACFTVSLITSFRAVMLLV